ncbi:MAG: hypothetical protein A2521_00930 [Deltaproteobacteria bacterium RIFOXYD12_FULL_57_12]|nr:MAG: hypothetical protein A2521_00930 [Deltaproteobacteria bacterium RIFOXYD12_FULL_57_12]
MQTKTKKRVRVVLVVIAVLLLIPAWFAYQLGIIPRIDRIQTFHAPVFGTDGQEVYCLTRDAWGISWGFGIESFTPPAAVIVLGDRFGLQKISRETGETTTIHTWRVHHPLKPKTQYRNYLFGIPECELRWEGRLLHYKIGLDFLPNDPPGLSVKEWAIGSWDAATKSLVETDTWKSGYQTTDRWTEQILAGPFEVVEYKSLALILYDSNTKTRTPLRISNAGGSQLQAEIATADLTDYLHRLRLERSRTIRETYAGLVAGFQAQGLPEGDAMLRANDEMEKKGYYPKTPKLVAEKIESGQPGVTIFTITADEFRFGLFQDIEKAIAEPGTEIHFYGNYITHRDFDTSKKLNEYLAAGNKSFIVQTDKGMFLIAIQ